MESTKRKFDPDTSDEDSDEPDIWKRLKRKYDERAENETLPVSSLPPWKSESEGTVAL